MEIKTKYTLGQEVYFIDTLTASPTKGNISMLRVFINDRKLNPEYSKPGEFVIEMEGSLYQIHVSYEVVFKRGEAPMSLILLPNRVHETHADLLNSMTIKPVDIST